MRCVYLLVLLWLPFLVQANQLILIIDDLGNNSALGEQVLALKAPLNLAFLPHTPQAKTLAQQAFKLGHGILLHAPMASLGHNKLGPGGLYPEMGKNELQSTFADNLAAIPHVQGFNNHMGSLLTSDAQAMRWIMQVAKRQNIFFVDSLTTADSVATEAAHQAGVSTLKRHVFLDNERTQAAMQQQFAEAITRAKQNGHVVLIGHPYPETIKFLQQALPQLTPQNIQLTRIDEYLQQELWHPFLTPSSYYSKFQLQ